MKNILCALAVLLAVYLYLDKFLFRGRLASLFVKGWRQLLCPRRAARRRAAREQTTHSAPPAPVHTDIVECKRYVGSLRMTERDNAPETAPKAVSSPTFDPAKEAGEKPVTEWMAPESGNRKTPRAEALEWENDEFALPEVSGDEDIIDPENIRREVVYSLRNVSEQDSGEELEPTDQEKYGIEHFDSKAFF